MAELNPAKQTPERRPAPGHVQPDSMSRSVSLSRSGWPAAAKTSSHRELRYRPRHRAAAVLDLPLAGDP